MIEMWWLKIKRKEVADENKCGGGIDLFITYVCAVKKNEEKRRKKNREIYGKEKNCEKKYGLMSPVPMI